MKLFSFSSYKPFVLITCLFVGNWAQAQAFSNTSEPQESCICLSQENVKELFLSAKAALKMDPTNEALIKTYHFWLEQIFLSFADPEANLLLYRILLRKIFPVAERVGEGAQKDIQKDSREWQEFKAFLELYAPGTERYNALPLRAQKRYIEALHQGLKGKL